MHDDLVLPALDSTAVQPPPPQAPQSGGGKRRRWRELSGGSRRSSRAQPAQLPAACTTEAGRTPSPLCSSGDMPIVSAPSSTLSSTARRIRTSGPWSAAADLSRLEESARREVSEAERSARRDVMCLRVSAIAALASPRAAASGRRPFASSHSHAAPQHPSAGASTPTSYLPPVSPTSCVTSGSPRMHGDRDLDHPSTPSPSHSATASNTDSSPASTAAAVNDAAIALVACEVDCRAVVEREEVADREGTLGMVVAMCLVARAAAPGVKEALPALEGSTEREGDDAQLRLALATTYGSIAHTAHTTADPPSSFETGVSSVSPLRERLVRDGMRRGGATSTSRTPSLESHGGGAVELPVGEDAPAPAPAALGRRTTPHNEDADRAATASTTSVQVLQHDVPATPPPRRPDVTAAPHLLASVISPPSTLLRTTELPASSHTRRGDGGFDNAGGDTPQAIPMHAFATPLADVSHLPGAAVHESAAPGDAPASTAKYQTNPPAALNAAIAGEPAPAEPSGGSSCLSRGTGAATSTTSTATRGKVFMTAKEKREEARRAKAAAAAASQPPPSPPAPQPVQPAEPEHPEQLPSARHDHRPSSDAGALAAHLLSHAQLEEEYGPLLAYANSLYPETVPPSSAGALRRAEGDAEASSDSSAVEGAVQRGVPRAGEGDLTAALVVAGETDDDDNGNRGGDAVKGGEIPTVVGDVASRDLFPGYPGFTVTAQEEGAGGEWLAGARAAAKELTYDDEDVADDGKDTDSDGSSDESLHLPARFGTMQLNPEDGYGEDRGSLPFPPRDDESDGNEGDGLVAGGAAGTGVAPPADTADGQWWAIGDPLCDEDAGADAAGAGGVPSAPAGHGAAYPAPAQTPQPPRAAHPPAAGSVRNTAPRRTPVGTPVEDPLMPPPPPPALAVPPASSAAVVSTPQHTPVDGGVVAAPTPQPPSASRHSAPRRRHHPGGDVVPGANAAAAPPPPPITHGEKTRKIEEKAARLTGQRPKTTPAPSPVPTTMPQKLPAGSGEAAAAVAGKRATAQQEPVDEKNKWWVMGDALELEEDEEEEEEVEAGVRGPHPVHGMHVPAPPTTADRQRQRPAAQPQPQPPIDPPTSADKQRPQRHQQWSRCVSDEEKYADEEHRHAARLRRYDDDVAAAAAEPPAVDLNVAEMLYYDELLQAAAAQGTRNGSVAPAAAAPAAAAMGPVPPPHAAQDELMAIGTSGASAVQHMCRLLALREEEARDAIRYAETEAKRALRLQGMLDHDAVAAYHRLVDEEAAYRVLFFNEFTTARARYRVFAAEKARRMDVVREERVGYMGLQRSLEMSVVATDAVFTLFAAEDASREGIVLAYEDSVQNLHSAVRQSVIQQHKVNIVTFVHEQARRDTIVTCEDRARKRLLVHHYDGAHAILHRAPAPNDGASKYKAALCAAPARVQDAVSPAAAMPAAGASPVAPLNPAVVVADTTVAPAPAAARGKGDGKGKCSPAVATASPVWTTGDGASLPSMSSALMSLKDDPDLASPATQIPTVRSQVSDFGELVVSTDVPIEQATWFNRLVGTGSSSPSGCENPQTRHMYPVSPLRPVKSDATDATPQPPALPAAPAAAAHTPSNAAGCGAAERAAFDGVERVDVGGAGGERGAVADGEPEGDVSAGALSSLATLVTPPMPPGRDETTMRSIAVATPPPRTEPPTPAHGADGTADADTAPHARASPVHEKADVREEGPPPAAFVVEAKEAVAVDWDVHAAAADMAVEEEEEEGPQADAAATAMDAGADAGAEEAEGRRRELPAAVTSDAREAAPTPRDDDASAAEAEALERLRQLLAQEEQRTRVGLEKNFLRVFEGVLLDAEVRWAEARCAALTADIAALDGTEAAARKALIDDEATSREAGFTIRFYAGCEAISQRYLARCLLEKDWAEEAELICSAGLCLYTDARIDFHEGVLKIRIEEDRAYRTVVCDITNGEYTGRCQLYQQESRKRQMFQRVFVSSYTKLTGEAPSVRCATPVLGDSPAGLPSAPPAPLTAAVGASASASAASSTNVSPQRALPPMAGGVGEATVSPTRPPTRSSAHERREALASRESGFTVCSLSSRGSLESREGARNVAVAGAVGQPGSVGVPLGLAGNLRDFTSDGSMNPFLQIPPPTPPVPPPGVTIEGPLVVTSMVHAPPAPHRVGSASALRRPGSASGKCVSFRSPLASICSASEPSVTTPSSERSAPALPACEPVD